MRSWLDPKGAIITDEQVLRYVATFGSLSGALERGDIRLLSDTGDPAPRPKRRPGERRRLADYMEDD